jgi:hypothetical protein
MLLKRVHGEIEDVCSDKANSCGENAKLVSKLRGRLFLMPRSNASSKGEGVSCVEGDDALSGSIRKSSRRGIVNGATRRSPAPP